MASIGNPPSSRELGVLVVGLGLVAALIWLPALSTPFWGDDYLFLQGALTSRLRGEPWWSPFWPDIRIQFWRPLGHETYWRFVEGVLGADPWAAHLTNFVLWLLGCLSVGFLSAALARALSWGRPRIGGTVAAGVYALSAVHFTPLHWTSSGDSLLVVLWSALALAAWVASPMSRPPVRAFLSVSVPILQVLALFSKESAVLLPLLMMCLSAFVWERFRPGLLEAAAWVACSALILVWLALRVRFVLPSPPEYSLIFEENVLRNIASLAAWCLNIPREALRMILLGPRAEGVLWALAVGVPMGAFLYVAIASLIRRVSALQVAAAVLFVILGYGPYYFLAWQSYEYYAQITMIMPSILLARGIMMSARAPVALVLFALSSFIAIEGSRLVSYPGLIGRARWAEEQLSNLMAHEALGNTTLEVSTPLLVKLANQHEFYAIGTSGLAWRLALPQSEVAIVDGCTGEGNGLLDFQRGNTSFVECAADDMDD